MAKQPWTKSSESIWQKQSYFLQVIYAQYLGLSGFALSENCVFKVGSEARELIKHLDIYVLLLYLISKASQVPNNKLTNRITTMNMAQINQSKNCLSIIFPEHLLNRDPVSSCHL